MGLYDAQIVAGNRSQLDALREKGLDLKNHSSRQEGPKRLSVRGILTDTQVDALRKEGYGVTVLADLEKVAAERAKDVSQTNRFAAAPRTAEVAAMEEFSYLTAEEVEDAIKNLGVNHPDLTMVSELPNKTWEGRTSHFIRLGKGEKKAPKSVLLTGSMHAREWGGSDICLGFMTNLIQAYETGSGVAYGAKVFSPEQVKTILDRLYIYIFPDVNPDGKHHSQTVYRWWRKNRNPNTNVDPNWPGVDLNRNFDLLWNSGIGTSAEPGSDIYRGQKPFSEFETQNILHLFDTYRDIRYYVDIHSYSELFLRSWGHETNQTVDPDQNFANPAFDGQRANPNFGYEEFIEPVDEILSVGLAQRMNAALKDVRGTTYTVQQGVALYPTSGTSSDYAFSRHQADRTLPEIAGFTIEFGKEFIPPGKEMQLIVKDVSAALTELCWMVGCLD